MLINHESPLFLLEESFKFNDYEYILPLFWDIEEYRNHFIKAKQRGRFIILDNGLFEGKLEDKEKLLQIYEEINPDVLISPDSWNNARETWNLYQEWKNIVDPSKLMGVIQASTVWDARYLYTQFEEDGIKYIGFNHLGRFYNDCSTHSNPYFRKTLGRINFFHDFIKLNDNIHHHLLGVNLAEELKYQLDIPQIKSVDTSNPIALAFEGKSYLDDIQEKPKINIEHMMKSDLDEENKQKIITKALDNIYYFRTKYTL